MTRKAYLAFDLGAESGRAMLAALDGDHVELQEIHRFANRPQHLPSGYHWNLQDLWTNLMSGAEKAAAATSEGLELVSMGIDTWGVDFGLIGRSGQLLGVPFAYRDERNAAAYRKTVTRLGQASIYEATGIQLMPLNSLYQLVAQHEAEPVVLEQADRMLMIPDLLHYFLTGVAVNEATDASTTQMIDPRRGDWAWDLLKQVGLPTQMLGDLVPAATPLGPLRRSVASQTGLEKIQVIAPGTHDTASAVAAVPVDESNQGNWAYLSSGTWSLMGAELDGPIITDASRKLSFTNERGVQNKIRFLRNIAGLWLVQECRREFARHGRNLSYPQLTQMAAASDPLRTLVNPDHPPFANPGDMLVKVATFAQATGQPAPQTPGQFIRCCLESLAFAYRLTLTSLEQVLNRSFDVLHIVGGGGQNQLLNQMTADALDRRVIVGPYEATAVGNALTQAIGTGQIGNLSQLRQIVRRSFELTEYLPKAAETYNAQVARFEALLNTPES